MGQVEREIVLDVETTGRKAGEDRIIEVCAIVIEGARETGESYHQMFNPEREVDPGAEQVHGWNWERLKGFPTFRREARKLAAFLGSAPIVAHNGTFDMRFLQAEFAEAKVPVQLGELRDTLPIARRALPGGRHRLEDLCQRLGIDDSGRTKHGALIDVQLLMQVYVKLLGRDQLIPVAQEAAAPAVAEAAAAAAAAVAGSPFRDRRPRPVPQPAAEEIERHAAFLASLWDPAKGVLPIWSRGGPPAV